MNNVSYQVHRALSNVPAYKESFLCILKKLKGSNTKENEKVNIAPGSNGILELCGLVYIYCIYKMA